MDLSVGLRGEAAITVDQAQSANALGTGNLPTLGTSALIALLERAAVNAIRRALHEGEESVGTMVNIRHLAPTPLGKRVRAEAVITAIDGPRITFDVRASDAVALVAEGSHERVLVDREDFVWKAAARGAGR